MELVTFVNVPYDRMWQGRRIAGESMQETAVRLTELADTPPAPVPVTPMELRDPDAPAGWYDTADMSAFWG